MPHCTCTSDPCISCVRGPQREAGSDICDTCRAPDDDIHVLLTNAALNDERTAWELGDHWEPVSWSCDACGEPESVHDPSHEVQGLTYCHRCIGTLLGALEALREAGLLVYAGGQIAVYEQRDGAAWTVVREDGGRAVYKQEVSSGECDTQRPDDWYGALLAWVARAREAA